MAILTLFLLVQAPVAAGSAVTPQPLPARAAAIHAVASAEVLRCGSFSAASACDPVPIMPRVNSEGRMMWEFR